MHLDQRKYDEKPLTRVEIIIILLFSISFLVLMGMEIISDYQPRKLSAILFVIFWIPLLFIHEFGHAIMAKLLGWEVSQIHIGIGQRLVSSQIFGVPIEIRAIPLEGFVKTAPKENEYSRYKNALIYFAGPGIELLIFFTILWVLGNEWMFAITDNYANIALQSFAFAALAGAVINLIPVAIITKDGTTPNDGLGIILSLFEKEEQTPRN